VISAFHRDQGSRNPEFLIPDDVPEKLSRNVGMELQLYAT